MEVAAMTTVSTTDPYALDRQIHLDSLIMNAVSPFGPGDSFPVFAALQWGGLTFAEYAFTLGGNLAQFYPLNGGAGNPGAFVNQVFENALGRSASSSETAFYETVMSADANGWSETIMYVGLSPESQVHNAHLMVHV
jgi:hypothetical protein